MHLREDPDPDDRTASPLATVSGLVIGALAGVALWLVIAALFTDLI